MARSDPQVNIRMPAELKTQLEDIAKSSGRSVNAEIVARLSASMSGPSMRDLAERRKLELIAEYSDFCKLKGLDPMRSFTAFANAYDGEVSGITVVEIRYLSELYSTWILERPSRFHSLSDGRATINPATDLRTFLELIRIESMARGITVSVTFSGEPDNVKSVSDSIAEIRRVVKKSTPREKP